MVNFKICLKQGNINVYMITCTLSNLKQHTSFCRNQRHIACPQLPIFEVRGEFKAPKRPLECRILQLTLLLPTRQFSATQLNVFTELV